MSTGRRYPFGRFLWTALALSLLLVVGGVRADAPETGRSSPLSSAPLAADALDVEMLGHIGGSTMAVAVQGDYAYVGRGLSLDVVDISDPAAPALVGKTAPRHIYILGICVSGDYAYLAAQRGGLRVIDVSDPAQPVEVGVYNSVEMVYGVAVVGDLAYVAAGNAGLRLVDVSDPSQPTQVGYYNTPGTAWDVALIGEHAYVADSHAGLRVIDVSNPAWPQEIGSVASADLSWGVEVVDGYLYLADYSELRVFDVTDPAHPNQVGGFGGRVNDVVIGDGYAYGVGYEGYPGYWVADISVPSAPARLGFHPYGDLASLDAIGDLLFVARRSGGGFEVLNVADPNAPASTGIYDPLGEVRGIDASGNYVYAVDTGGLWIVDVSDPTAPAPVSFHSTEGLAMDVAVSGDFAYVSQSAGSGNGGFQVVDIQDLSHPTLLGTLRSRPFLTSQFSCIILLQSQSRRSQRDARKDNSRMSVSHVPAA